ncbi:MAG: DUF998 domain-containing protein, partial [Acidilobaceae archaeon]
TRFVTVIEFSRWLWLLALAVFIVALVFSTYLNRDWFSFTANALSDLGSDRARAPLIFNASLIVSAVVLAGYSIYLYERFGKAVATSMLATSLMLAGVGLFPEGRSLHVFFAVLFFAMAYVTVALTSIKLYARGSAGLSLALAFLILVAMMGLLIPWPSVALLELYLIAVMTLCFLLISKAGSSLD